jgi:hypothetical protein
VGGHASPNVALFTLACDDLEILVARPQLRTMVRWLLGVKVGRDSSLSLRRLVAQQDRLRPHRAHLAGQASS